MLITQELLKNEPLIQDELALSLHESYLRTWRNCSPNKPEETDFIVDLSSYWITDFVNILKNRLSLNFKVGISGIFCHQKPLADFGGATSSEIGDLLFVMEYEEFCKQPIFNSLLLQAKVSPDFIVTLKSADEHQLKLYEFWPKFKYLRAGALNNKPIDIKPKCRNSGAKYFLIDPKYQDYVSFPVLNNFPFGCAIPHKTLVLSKIFSEDLFDFLNFNSGKMISDKNSITEDWSEMIWDMLKITANKKAIRTRSGHGGGFPRQTSKNNLNVANFVGDFSEEEYVDSGGNGIFNNIFEGDISDDETGGISTLYIKIQQTESNR